MDNKKTRIILILRVIILTLLIIFLFVFITTAKTDCQACSFNIEGEEYSAEEFLQLYYDKCISFEKVYSLEPSC